MRRQALNEKRREILEFIAKATEEHGYPPTVREIGEAVGLKSSSTVHFHLRILADSGYLHRDGSLTRALRLSEKGQAISGEPSVTDLREARRAAETRWLRLVGEVAAGQPVFAVEDRDDLVPLPAQFVPNGEAFMLRVSGDSMIDAGIRDGDYAIVSRASSADEGEIVVAMVDDEATVKYFHRHGSGFELRPANEALTPIFVDEVQILGKVTGLLRSLS
ncbi:MAG: transcriptional repressor LexA [Armatimonadetes bacterium]|nr:transcriptional repressor LexA [Armatimonadota bacterium]